MRYIEEKIAELKGCRVQTVDVFGDGAHAGYVIVARDDDILTEPCRDESTAWRTLPRWSYYLGPALTLIKDRDYILGAEDGLHFCLLDIVPRETLGEPYPSLFAGLARYDTLPVAICHAWIASEEARCAK